MLHTPFPLPWVFLDALPFCLSCYKLFRLIEIKGNGELLIHDGRGKSKKLDSVILSLPPHSTWNRV